MAPPSDPSAGATLLVGRAGSADEPETAGLLARARAARAHEPLSEHARLELGRPGTVAVTARAGGRLVGLAPLTAEHASTGVEVVLDPDWAGTSPWPGAALVAAALEAVAGQGGGAVDLWLVGPGDEAVAAVEALGLRPARQLLQLRAPLPLGVTAEAPPGLRPFRPGSDEAAWLAVNNRAFADHPEQGGWSEEDLRRREAEPWFDPAGFLLAEEDGRLVGSCWTKIHRDTDPVLGEIYVISVDPARHHSGLGRALTVAGLDWLAGQGVPVGMLYVDADNGPALALYRSLGFRPDHTDRAWRTEVAPRT
jgi:mycothiol synthase